MRILNISLITIFIKINIVASSFKTIILNNGNYLIINNNGIYTYDKNSLLILKSYNFENTVESQNQILIENIPFFELYSYNSIFILIMDNLFIFSLEGDYKYKLYNFKKININKYSLNFFKCLNSIECLYFVEYINTDNNLVIELYQYNFSLNSNSLLSLTKSNIKIENKIYCHLMINSNNENYITCFSEGKNNNDILGTTFFVNNINNEINYFNSKTYSINSVKLIKSVISDDKTKSLVCFSDIFNNTKCLLYDINTLEFSDNIIPLKNCLYNIFYSFNIIKSLDSNNYFLYCFYSSNELSLISLDRYFNIISDFKDYFIKNNLINKCNEYYYSYLLYSSYSMNILSSCEKESFSLAKYPLEEEYIDMINMKTNIPQTSIYRNINKIISKVQIRNYYKIKGEDYNISISKLEEQNNGYFIDFLNCKEKLKEFYNYKELILFLIEKNIDNEKWLNNEINYALFNENKEQLNLSICKDENITIHYKIKNDSLLNLSKITHFDELGVNVFNLEDRFFNDICFPYAENGADIILRDRLDYFYENFSVCEEGCIYEKTDILKKAFICNCPILYSFEDNKEKNNSQDNKIVTLKNSHSNIDVLKCYKEIFNRKIDLKNFGFWAHLLTTLFHISIYILHCILGIVPMQKYIKNEMEKYHYIINYEEETERTEKKAKNKESDNNTRNNQIVVNIQMTNEIDNDDNENKNSFKKIKLRDNEINTIKESSDQNEFKIDRIHTFKRKRTIKLTERIHKNINKKDLVEYYQLIKIDANNDYNNKKPIESNYILKNYDYNLALEYENRTFLRLTYIILLSKDDALNAIFFKSPLHIKYLRICLLVFSFSNDIALNTLFYSNEKISDEFHYVGNHEFWHSIYHNLLTTILTTIISKLICFFLEFLTQSISSIEKEFRNEEKKMKEDKSYIVNDEKKLEIQRNINKILKNLKIKISLFFIIELILMIFYFYLSTAFCTIFKYTQINIIKDSVISFLLALPTSFLTALVLTILYKISLKYKIELLYKIILFVV